MIGRPHPYGLAVGGRAGVERVLACLRAEIDTTLGLLGVPRITDLDRSALRPAPPASVSADQVIR